MYISSGFQNQSAPVSKASEMPPPSRSEAYRRLRQERLSDFAQRHGIDGLAYCEPEEEDSALFQEINFVKLVRDEQWYEHFKGNELKTLFTQKKQSFAKLDLESDSDGSQIMAGKKRKRKRYNSGSSNQSKPRNRSKASMDRKLGSDGVANKDLLQAFLLNLSQETFDL